MYILCDIGGTKIRIAGSTDLQSFSDPVVIKTPSSLEDGVRALEELVQKIRGDERIEAASFGIPGELNERGILSMSPNMKSWVGAPIKAEFERICKAKVFIHNDAALVGLGEAVHGRGRGFPIVAYITVSTGVGGVRVVNGAIDEASIGFEPGHQLIDMDNSVCPDCEAPATLEHYVGGEALKKRFGVEPYEVRDPNVWEELSKYLAHGLYNTILHWSPDVVVLGGSMIVGDPAISVLRVKAHLESMPKVFHRLPEILEASLKDFGGLYGGMAFLKSNALNNPLRR